MTAHVCWLPARRDTRLRRCPIFLMWRSTRPFTVVCSSPPWCFFRQHDCWFAATWETHLPHLIFPTWWSTREAFTSTVLHLPILLLPFGTLSFIVNPHGHRLPSPVTHLLYVNSLRIVTSLSWCIVGDIPSTSHRVFKSWNDTISLCIDQRIWMDEFLVSGVMGNLTLWLQ